MFLGGQKLSKSATEEIDTNLKQLSQLRRAEHPD